MTGVPGLSYRLAAKLFSGPVAIDLRHGMMLRDALESRQFDVQYVSADASKFVGQRDQRSRYRVTEDGIAVVPVQGMLIDRGDWLGDLGGFATSYEGLAEQCRRLAADPAIKAVILDVDSPGGMAAGLFDLVENLRDLRKSKKLYALAANMADSAAYAIAATAQEAYVTRTGEVGSIGTVMIHMSYERMLDRQGIDPTIIASAAHKADGNPYQQLGHTARAAMAAEIEFINDAFVGHVVKHRPIEEADVRAMEARTYTGKNAVTAKLVDGVRSFDELLEHVREAASAPRRRADGPSTQTGGRMSTEPTAAAPGQPNYAALVDEIVANMQAARTNAPPVQSEVPAVAPAAADPVTAPVQSAATERTRIDAILSCTEAKDRPGLARHLALKTEHSAESAREILSAAAVEVTTSDDLGNALERRMREPGNSARVAPEGAGASGQRSLADKMAARHKKS